MSDQSPSPADPSIAWREGFGAGMSSGTSNWINPYPADQWELRRNWIEGFARSLGSEDAGVLLDRGAAATIVRDLGGLADQILALRRALAALDSCDGAGPVGSHAMLEQFEEMYAVLVDRPGVLTGTMPWYRSWQAGGSI